MNRRPERGPPSPREPETGNERTRRSALPTLSSSWSQCENSNSWRLSMNRRIQHRDLEDTEPGRARNLCVLQNSVLNQGYARWTVRFMAPMRVQNWRSRLSMNLGAPAPLPARWTRRSSPARGPALPGLMAPLRIHWGRSRLSKTHSADLRSGALATKTLKRAGSETGAPFTKDSGEETTGSILLASATENC